MKEISPSELAGNVFDEIGKTWMLVTAGDEQKANTMTASWGALGIMWGKPAATIYLRPQRFTKTFVDDKGSFSLSFLPEDYREQLGYLGRVSGRDEDKIATSGLTLAFADGVPYFEEAKTVLVCRTAFSQKLEEDSFADRDAIERWYPEKDLHTMYIAYIEKVLVAD